MQTITKMVTQRKSNKWLIGWWDQYLSERENNI